MHLVTMHHFCKSYVNDVGFWELLLLFKKRRMYYLLSCKYVCMYIVQLHTMFSEVSNCIKG